jgi:predicted dinucleotide-binding enzyme
MMRIGVIGSGGVGQTLAKGFMTHGYEVRIATRSAAKLAAFSAETGIASGQPSEVAAWAETVVLAVKGSMAADAVRQAGPAHVAGKLVIDTTNPIADLPPEDGVLRFFTSLDQSLMERLQAEFPEAKFVKAFSTVGSALMVNPSFANGRSTLFICGNDAEAKATVAQIIGAFGHDVSDMGSAKAARAIEPLCMLWCIPGFLRNQWHHAFSVVGAQ